MYQSNDITCVTNATERFRQLRVQPLCLGWPKSLLASCFRLAHVCISRLYEAAFDWCKGEREWCWCKIREVMVTLRVCCLSWMRWREALSFHVNGLGLSKCHDTQSKIDWVASLISPTSALFKPISCPVSLNHHLPGYFSRNSKDATNCATQNKGFVCFGAISSFLACPSPFFYLSRDGGASQSDLRF